MVGLGIGVGVEKVTGSGVGERGRVGAGVVHAVTIAANVARTSTANSFMMTVYREKNILAMGFVLTLPLLCAKICRVTDLGIVIVNHNTRDLLRDCLR